MFVTPIFIPVAPSHPMTEDGVKGLIALYIAGLILSLVAWGLGWIMRNAVSDVWDFAEFIGRTLTSILVVLGLLFWVASMVLACL